MKLSLFLLLDRDGATDDLDPIDHAMELCEAAERIGYDAVWVAEHHFRDFGGMPNPAVFLAAVAARTRRIRLGPAVAVLPFRSPVSIAEDYALVDRLSAGRLNMGVGSGTLDFEFEGFGIDPAEKRARFAESLAALRALWTADRVTQRGRHTHLANVGLNVRTIQRPGPPLYVATNQVEAARDAGRQGLGLLTLVSPATATLDEIAPRLAAHRAGIAEGEHAPGRAHVAVALFAHVAVSPDAARSAAAAPLARFAATHGFPAAGNADLYERMASNGTALFGSPDETAPILGRLRAMGADEAILWMSFGGLAAARIVDSMARIENQLRPRLGGARTG